MGWIVVLVLGGGLTFLAGMAAQNPGVMFVGAALFLPGMALVGLSLIGASIMALLGLGRE